MRDRLRRWDVRVDGARPTSVMHEDGAVTELAKGDVYDAHATLTWTYQCPVCRLPVRGTGVGVRVVCVCGEGELTCTPTGMVARPVGVV